MIGAVSRGFFVFIIVLFIYLFLLFFCAVLTLSTVELLFSFCFVFLFSRARDTLTYVAIGRAPRVPSCLKKAFYDKGMLTFPMLERS